MALARHLLTNYETDPRVTTILNTTDVHILPTLNPDGFEKSVEGKSKLLLEGNHQEYIFTSGNCGKAASQQIGRSNSNNVDLNRNFPNSEAYLTLMSVLAQGSSWAYTSYLSLVVVLILEPEESC